MGFLATLSHLVTKFIEKSEYDLATSEFSISDDNQELFDGSVAEFDQVTSEYAMSYDNQELVEENEAEFNQLILDLYKRVEDQYKRAEDQCEQIISNLKKASETDLEYADVCCNLGSDYKDKGECSFAELQAELEEKAKSYARTSAETEKKLQAQTQVMAEIEEKLKVETQARLKAEKIAAAEARERATAETRAKTLAKAQAKVDKEMRAELEEKARAYEEILAKAEAKARAESEAKAEAERQARENDRQMKTIKHFRLHIDTCDIYAIEQRADARVVSSCGPLEEDDLKDLDSYDYSKKKNRWVQKNLNRLILWFP